MMDNLPNFSLLWSFIVLSEELSFRKTADRLRLDQSALTRRIQKLEYLIGAKLLERTTKDVSLTPAGQAFARRIKPVIDDYRSAIHSTQRLSNGTTGSIRIAYMAFAAYHLMPEAVTTFNQQYPDVEVTLQFMSTEQQKKAFAMKQLDVGFMYGNYSHSNYHCQTLLEEKLCLVAPKSHPLIQQTRIQASDLVGQRLVLGTPDMWREYRDKIKALYKSQGIEMKVGIEVSNTLALIGFVASGFGVTIYPQSLTKTLRHENVTAKPIDNEHFISETTLVYPRNHNNPVVDRLVDYFN